MEKEQEQFDNNPRPWYHLMGFGLLALVLGFLSLWVLLQLSGTRSSQTALQEIVHPLPLLVAASLLVISWCSRLARIWLLLQALQTRLSFMQFAKSYLAGAFVSHITPGMAGGYPFFLFLLNRQGVPAGKSLAISLMDSVNTGLVALTVLLSLLFISRETSSLPGQQGWTWLAMAAIAAITLIAVGFLLFPRMMRRLVLRYAHNWSASPHPPGSKASGWAYIAVQELFRLEQVTRSFWQEHRRALAINLGLNLLYWLAWSAMTPVLILATGYNVYWPAAMAIQMTVQFAHNLIPTPGAAGGAELTMAFLLRSLLPPGALVAFLVLWRGYTYYISLFFTAFTLPWIIKILRFRNKIK